MLLYAQDEVGYLSDAVISEVAARIGITELDVRNVISYYSLLHTKPRRASIMYRYAPTSVACCAVAMSCWPTANSGLGIGNKETTPDKLFSLEEVECIGACSWAPAVQVNYDFHENLTPDSMDKVLDDYRSRSEAADLSTRRNAWPISSPIQMKSS